MSERRHKMLVGAGLGTVASGAALAIIVQKTMERMYSRMKLLPPTSKQLAEEDQDANPLVRAVPALRGQIAWRQLGDFPTPVHRFTCQLLGGEEVEFLAKREDLSSGEYGGNKVRTLQYQLGLCEARAERAAGGTAAPRVLVMGTGGSNQVVATKLHAAKIGLDGVEALCFPDKKEMDNTLNYLSALSLPGKQFEYGCGGGSLVSAIWSGGDDAPWLFMPGGNNPAGVLGQVGGALELGEQISRGEAADPDAIVVTMGSMCTVTGIILGIALSRAVGYPAFCQPGFRIYGQHIHPGAVLLQRAFGAFRSEGLPLMIGRGIREVAAIIAERGGPDVTEEALRIMREDLIIPTDSKIVGPYGAHSEKSREAKAFYERSVRGPPDTPGLWLCGHFTAKAFALLLELLQQDGRKTMLFWQTKSAVQPLGPEDEWAAFEAQRKAIGALEKWGVLGGITGHPAVLGSLDGKHARATGPEQYRDLMTPVFRRSAM